jgi:hypothetical protein
MSRHLLTKSGEAILDHDLLRHLDGLANLPTMIILASSSNLVGKLLDSSTVMTLFLISSDARWKLQASLRGECDFPLY